MEALGRLYDLELDVAPASITTGLTGKRISLRNANALDFVVSLGAAGTGTEDYVLTPQQHTVETSGSPAALKISHYYIKAATLLAGTETWTKVWNTSDGTDPDLGTGTINSTITLTGATYAAKQCLVVIPVESTRLGVGSQYVSLNTGTVTNARVGSVLCVPHDLAVRRQPTNLKATLS